MKNRQIPVLPILFMVAIVAGIYGLYKTVELEEQTYFESQSAEARKNPFLAASRFLERHSFDTNTAENRGVLTQLDINETGVLLIDDLMELEDPREVESILNWIKSGGILLASPGDYDSFEDTNVPSELLQQLAVRSLEEHDIEANPEYSFDDTLFYLWPNDKDIKGKLTLVTDQSPYFINNSSDQDSMTTIIDSPALIYKSLANGYVGLYAAPDQFHNVQFDKTDHAYLLLWLTQPAITKSMTIIYQPTGKPRLFSFIWNKFTVSILMAGLVLAGFLRWSSARLGPVEQELPPINNNLMAHLEARGEYWYRHKHTPDIIAKVQQSTLEQLAKKQGKLRDRHANTAQLSDADSADMINYASKILKCSPAQAEKILFAQTSRDANILSTSRALQKINHQKVFNQQNLTE